MIIQAKFEINQKVKISELDYQGMINRIIVDRDTRVMYEVECVAPDGNRHVLMCNGAELEAV
jgi:hypothetical protein